MATTSTFDKSDMPADPSAVDEEEEVFRRPYHVRTASVILESGVRVRRNISLAPEYELPLGEDERSNLLGDGAVSGTGYSSISPSISARDIGALKKLWKHWFVKWVRSENPKRS